MSTTLIQAAAAGVRTFSTDPVIRTCVARLSTLVQAWFSEQGYVVREVKLAGDYLLNGNLGKQSVFMEVVTPSGLPVRTACEFRVRAEGDALLAWLQVRGAAGNGWVPLDSAQVELRYGEHPGVYKMELLSQRLLALLGILEGSTQLEGTSVSPMLRDLMDEVETSALA